MLVQHLHLRELKSISAFLLSTITPPPGFTRALKYLPLSKKSWLPWSPILSWCQPALHRGVHLHRHTSSSALTLYHLHLGATSSPGTILLETPNSSALSWHPSILVVAQPSPCLSPCFPGWSSSTSFESLLFPAHGGGG